MKSYKVIAWTSLSLVAFALIFNFSIIFRLGSKNEPSDYSLHAKKYDGSIFSLYQGKIYASVPSNGDYLIEEADANSFHKLDDHYQTRQVGIDQNHVYCGNLILPKLKPTQTRYIGNDYYTDGTSTYYCSQLSNRNKDLSIIKEIAQLILNQWGLSKKPQSSIYEFKEIPQATTPTKKSAVFGVTTVGDKVYLNGNELDKANGQTLRAIPRVYEDGDIRSSTIYLADGQHVYFKNKLLDLKDDPKLYSSEIDAQNQNEYLINPANGMVYLNELAFDEKNAPYQFLSLNGAHVNHTLFTSKNGIYFYDTEEEKVRRAGDNLFASGQFVEIAPLIFSDGKQILYIQASETWGKGRNRRLHERATQILRLDEPTTGQWEKLGNVDYNSGQVWKNGESYYYFDQLGDNQLVPKTIYKIVDTSIINRLIHSDLRSDDLRNLLNSDQVVEPKYTLALTAKTQYSSDYKWALLIPVIMFGTIYFFIWLMRKLKLNTKPFFIEEGKLEIANIFATKIPLVEITEVVFFIRRAVKGIGYTGNFYVQKQNGKSTRKYMFATQIRLTHDSYDELDAYIQVLQNELKQHHIPTRFLGLKD